MGQSDFLVRMEWELVETPTLTYFLHSAILAHITAVWRWGSWNETIYSPVFLLQHRLLLDGIVLFMLNHLVHNSSEESISSSKWSCTFVTTGSWPGAEVGKSICAKAGTLFRGNGLWSPPETRKWLNEVVRFFPQHSQLLRTDISLQCELLHLPKNGATKQWK